MFFIIVRISNFKFSEFFKNQEYSINYVEVNNL